MALGKDKKNEIVKNYRQGDRDCGSSEVQVALLTEKINLLVNHLRSHEKDQHGRFGLINLVSKRKAILAYLRKTNVNRYLSLIQKLGLRQ
jgi:small subunit ribosomal protein S15